METYQALSSHMDGAETIVVHVSRKPVAVARNHLAKAVGEIVAQKPDWNDALVLWIDDDAWWQSGAVTTMADRLLTLKELDVVAGWYSKREAFGPPAAWIFNESGQMVTVSKTNARYTEGESLCEVDAVGAHFMMHRVGLLRALGADPFSPLSLDVPSGEDIDFCKRVKSAGGRIFVSLSQATTVLHVDVRTGLAYAPAGPPYMFKNGVPSQATNAELFALGGTDGIATEERKDGTLVTDAGGRRQYGLHNEDEMQRAHVATEDARESPVLIFEALAGSNEHPFIFDLDGETSETALTKLLDIADEGRLPGLTLLSRNQKREHLVNVAAFVGTSRNGGARRVVVSRL